jgi:putative nucleotidyltransferase with HDIG domain
MSTGLPKRSRSTLQLPPGRFARGWALLRRGDVLLRVAVCALAAVLMWLVTAGWAPPFPYHLRHTPPRDVVARVDFAVPDPVATESAREDARTEVVCVYSNDPAPLDEVQRALTDRVFEVLSAGSFAAVDQQLWGAFQGRTVADAAVDEAQEQAAFERFRAALAEDHNLERLKHALELTFEESRATGLLQALEHSLKEGSQSEIRVYPQGKPEAGQTVPVSDVRFGEVAGKIQARLIEEMQESQTSNPEQVAAHLFNWLRPHLAQTTTLHWEREATTEAAAAAVARVADVERKYLSGERLEGVRAGEPLELEDLALLEAEYEAYVAQLSALQMAVHSLADFGMFAALYILCGFYLYYQNQRVLLDFRRFVTMLGAFVATVALVRLATLRLDEYQFSPRDLGRMELIPLMIFAMSATIAYRQELALLLSAALSLVSVLSLGYGVAEFVILLATMSATVYLTGRIRGRTKLIYVGLSAGGVAFSTTLGVSTLAGQPLGTALVIDAAWFGFSAVVSGLLMTGLLPFIERLFDVQTDLSLLELGDAAHPLLQELVRRAPGTYNHSINVASIGEAAAEAIAANGLLVRVGAYFHDIGKMLKPGYFVENQEQGVNRHESLVPAMSTLVIIAHVKDGAELARKHRLPQSIIDFIEQHHGTTLVEYFYNRAARRSEEDPDVGAVDESSFRYPGPKPQTREAGVLMLADAVESASRTLVEPTPARIENLVHEIAMKRLLDGQFDECSLTLKEINAIVESLSKSLTAVYHGRVKYPERQQTA